MSDESDNYELSDGEIDNKKHDKIVEEVLNLNKIQNVKKPSRTEPTLNISEFNLVKSVTGDKGTVQLNALTSLLKGRKKHEEISKKVKLTSTKNNTLPAPLEKPQAERIRRSVNYEKSRLQLDRWEALVTSNRVAPQLLFPLNSTEKLKIEQMKAETYPSTWRLKSDLQKELEKIQPKVEEYHINNEEEEKVPLTLKELKERSKEAAKLRVYQSYKEAKARRQNKIKSKKYHRILRRENIKKKLKEFEELQKTNPEEALKKLEDIEKARAEERFNLRHKGTGQWAKNKQIRAKYDRESRQALAQQLTISRDLTQKLKNVDSDSEEEIVDLEEKLDTTKENGDNPWISNIKPSNEITDFLSGYRKYWNEKSGKLENPTKNKSDCSTDEHKQADIEEMKSKTDKNKKNLKITSNEQIKSAEKDKSKTNKRKIDIKKSKKVKSSKATPNSTSDWDISRIESSDDVEDIFNKLEENLEKKLKTKYKKLGHKKNDEKKINEKKVKTKKIDLSMSSKSKNPVIREQMMEEANNIDVDSGTVTNDNSTSDINALKSILNSITEEEKPSEKSQKFMEVKSINLDSAKPDIVVEDENEENSGQTNYIWEAFEDFDIADDFKKEKQKEVQKDTPSNIDLNLPGWGSWSGTNIKTRKRRRRFIIKMPQKMPRRDDNKGSLIINEKAQSKIKPHMVSQVPFPFKSVKDYEASMRAPIGNTFVPETAFRKLIEPSVVTKMGAIIEPITKSVLMGERKV